MALRDSTCSKGLHGPDRQALDASNCHSCAAPENLIFAGSIGTGKTHLAIALGVEATKGKSYRMWKRRTAREEPS
jgi:DNA replication protein DnaC